MSELVPFFDEDEERFLDDNLLRSIETLLDDNELSSNGLSREQAAIPSAENGMPVVMTTTTTTPPPPPTTPTVPKYQSTSDGFAFGNQVYQKWSTTESGEQPPIGMKRNFTGGHRNHQPRSTNYVKPIKKNPVNSVLMNNFNALQQMRANAEIAQYQALLAEKANQLLTQYLRLNYDHLNAQAQILGIPLEQYVRNLLIALNSQSFLLPPQPIMFAPPYNPLYMTMPSPTSSGGSPSPPSTPSPTTSAHQRAWQNNKQYFSKKH